jgi:hypothetical protein
MTSSIFLKLGSFPTAILLSSLIIAPSLMAQDPDPLPEENWDGAPLVSLEARTIFPLYVGAGIQLHASPQLRIGLDFGQTPGAYAEAIGSLGSRLKGNDNYKPTLVAAFANNSLYRIYLRYNFTDEPTGFGIEVGLTQISSKGEEKISDVARVAANGQNYQGILNSVSALGYRPYVDMKTKMLLADIMGVYQWELAPSLHASAGAGLAKVTGAEVDLSTEVSEFDSSKLGIALLSMAESDLASGIERYGLSPLISLDIAYSF